MTVKTFNQLRDEGTVKRADAMKVRFEDLHVEPDFNLRDDIESLTGDAREEAEADEESLFQHIMDGGLIPDLEVRPREEGGVFIVDGHRRHRNIGRAIAVGAPLKGMRDKEGVVWVSVKPFDGDEDDRDARVITSQHTRKLRDLELARGCQRMAARGRTPEQIAKKVRLTRQRVDQLLILASASPEVHQRMRAGQVSGAVAVELVRKHGDQAGKVLEAELEKAKAAGKGKVTAGTMKGATVPRGLLDDMHVIATTMHKQFKPDDLVAIERYHRGEITEGTVEISLEAAMQFHLMLEEAARVLEEKETKLREKANKAAQLELAQDGAE